MANRRKFIAGLGALATGSAAAMGTGAFTSVEANRGVSVYTKGDADAYLGLSGDGEYVDDDSSSSELTIDLGAPGNLGTASGSGSSGTQGDGFNDSAVTTVEDVVTVTNQGRNDIQVDFTDGDTAGETETTVNLTNAQVTFSRPAGGNDQLEPGESTDLDATVNTIYGGDGDGGDLTIYAYEITI